MLQVYINNNCFKRHIILGAISFHTVPLFNLFIIAFQSQLDVKLGTVLYIHINVYHYKKLFYTCIQNSVNNLHM